MSINLSEEKKLRKSAEQTRPNEKVNSTITKYRYQKRIEFQPYPLGVISGLWRIDLTEYGDGSSEEEAKLNYIKNTQTSVEIELAIGDSENQMSVLYKYNKNLFYSIFKNLPLSETNLSNRRDILFNVNNEIIIKDLCYTLIYLFNKIF